MRSSNMHSAIKWIVVWAALTAVAWGDLQPDCRQTILAEATVIGGVREIAQDYDVFILDMCGVIYDQTKTFEGAIETVQMLQSLGKKVLIMGNAPVSRVGLQGRVKKLSMDIAPEYLWSGGEIFLRDLKEANVPGWKDGLKVYCVERGSFWNEITQIAPSAQRVDDIKEAQMLILLSDTNIGDPESIHDTLLRQAAELGIPMLCINPDLWAIKGDEAIVYTPGTWAKRYEAMGGTILAFYGKPHSKIYDSALEHLRQEGFSDRERMIMVGDTMYTDIEGAAKAGIHSLWILHGSHRDRVLDANGDVDLEGMLEVMQEYQLFPNWAAKAFRW